MNPIYLIAIIPACVILGAILGPAMHTAFAEAKMKVESQYATQLADAQKELSQIKMKAQNDVMQAKLEAETIVAAVNKRASTAEADLATLRRFLPNMTPATPVTAPVAASPAIGDAPTPAQTFGDKPA